MVDPQWRRRYSWLGLASLGLRFYLHFFNSYSVTYGSLGAVVIVLTWFYITGLVLLLGAEINSERSRPPPQKITYPNPPKTSLRIRGRNQRLRVRNSK